MENGGPMADRFDRKMERKMIRWENKIYGNDDDGWGDDDGGDDWW